MCSLDRVNPRQRILFIDAFDSFSNNIIGLLEQYLDVDVVVVHIDDREASRKFTTLVDEFDAVVVGPGPGHPSNPDDVGLIDQVWRLEGHHEIPVLGICLGFQSLCLSQGANVSRLARARHGIVNSVAHGDCDIFAGVGSLRATQYHSLRVQVAPPAQEEPFWSPTDACPLMIPLAWDLDDNVNGPILMGARHATRPLWGVQFHPESICTSDEGRILLQNWWSHSQRWLEKRGRKRLPVTWCAKSPLPNGTATRSGGHALAQELQSDKPISLLWKKHAVLSTLTAPRLVEALGQTRGRDIIVLDSQGHASGRYSILGLVIPGRTVKVTYRVSSQTLQYGTEGGKTTTAQLRSVDDIWSLFQEVLDRNNPRKTQPAASHGGPLPDDSPFWGGFMGYLSYEVGLETIGVEPHPASDSLFSDDESWVDETGRLVSELRPEDDVRADTEALLDEALLDEALARADTTRPAEDAYRDKVLQCQGYLSSGDSYELCLTDETTMEVPRDSLDGWALYRRLRQNNPAPFGAFIRLSGTTVVGSSPEKFLSWTRTGHCQFRPIKGTVKKSAEMTRERAHAILSSSKERAENLMIVDLIRHDLSGVVGAHNTSVSKLMVMEEYETVYQLVSVIDGRFDTGSTSGINVLKASLPPGSMTGAPKKRSCEILRDIENRSRGIYSGVLGFMDVGGAGQFSVVIRTAVRGETDPENSESDTWRVGAGGAVTIQSTDDGEFHEMEAKQSSVLASLFRRKDA
ncbi:para-aminobenzoate synthetase [Geosmithia morbida]|uniref:aminodeoxychorismate synthase n=1 Tax=Geosmithia morbida TaxID=1094350 RepID=A0A9P5D3W8_9HYPO|nr:para-aminobenzoate synthetase [Geosmithia morbida]KAF4120919.1 para-aminobenzoate synthetase [Geosmithia morbida]